jgi:hypothetical protein
MAKKTDVKPDPEVQLARYLASAFIAYSQGIGMDYARKRYAHMPVGPLWIEVARMVSAGTAQANDRAAFTVSVGSKNTIDAPHHDRKAARKTGGLFALGSCSFARGAQPFPGYPPRPGRSGRSGVGTQWRIHEMRVSRQG